ncbi:hypothetical protein [uncultured Mucilaginibacter sp.]|uniref:hypothetical protein n=1 Tax=uncultured Mucilaginibacter sp. TaxID=797541 RepID=UPI0025CFF1C4|nr:hypothetical protein [uncultured Mucilaginibacter sp.]
MKPVNLFLCLLLVFASCKKNSKRADDSAKESEYEKTEKNNSAKVSVANGVWGTVYKKEGDCMPYFGNGKSTCRQYAIQREVRVYKYTTIDDASPKSPVNGLYDKFETQLIKTTNADAAGFFEAELPNGKYTVILVEEGKLYVSGWDGKGGISPVEVQQNKVKANLVLNRAVY